MICCKLIEMGEKVLEREISDDPTVQGLFDACERDYPDDDEFKVTRRNVDVTPETELKDGDKVFVGRKVKGNQDPNDMFEVKLIKMGSGGGIKSIAAADGMTIKEVIDQLPESERKSYYRADGTPAFEYRINHVKQDEDFVLKKPAGDKSVNIILSQKVKGND